MNPTKSIRTNSMRTSSSTTIRVSTRSPLQEWNNPEDDTSQNQARLTETRRRPSSSRRSIRKSVSVNEIDERPTSLVANVVTPEKRIKNRHEENSKRRAALEKRRHTLLLAKTGLSRKAKHQEEARQRESQKLLLQILAVGRLQVLVDALADYRRVEEEEEVRNRASRIITRNMRKYANRRYRKRVFYAIRAIGSVAVAKVRQSRIRRRQRADKIMRRFLRRVVEQKQRTGMSLADVLKYKRFKRSRQCVIVIQRYWRTRLRSLRCQEEVVDIQWQKEQDIRTDLKVTRIHKEQRRNAEAESVKLESINRMRRLMKLQLLPPKKVESPLQILRRLLEGTDLLDYGHIVPRDIRILLIKEFLASLRRNLRREMRIYRKELEKIEVKIKERREFLGRLSIFAGPGFVAQLERDTESASEALSKNGNHGKGEDERALRDLGNQMDRLRRQKPKLSVFLREEVLGELMNVGDRLVESLRIKWAPDNFDFCKLDYDKHGRAIAELHRNLEIVGRG
mmetsp:Transcript_5389/g.11522  ORF Transcript_5389/g.11522 Transcript_5389/m.11522 type:complete len:510 (-) Transcript_5389:62-1591(-)|eukprot:CAMPEP_0171373710 /NCGR_PEP_ID=MMETSP0879-20121228/13259_1 /TAXON_ID=67004 /ORGANISM="Thalassiosira weissflogii, Strain CCMP1336" /LENGTH=509 /DNA_ID=CAMNT_0011882899 /DNA_START=60 /DNA_END=1589 /DNA_ORIENTATION=-